MTLITYVVVLSNQVVRPTAILVIICKILSPFPFYIAIYLLHRSPFWLLTK